MYIVNIHVMPGVIYYNHFVYMLSVFFNFLLFVCTIRWLAHVLVSDFSPVFLAQDRLHGSYARQELCNELSSWARTETSEIYSYRSQSS